MQISAVLFSHQNPVNSANCAHYACSLCRCMLDISRKIVFKGHALLGGSFDKNCSPLSAHYLTEQSSEMVCSIRVIMYHKVDSSFDRSIKMTEDWQRYRRDTMWCKMCMHHRVHDVIRKRFSKWIYLTLYPVLSITYCPHVYFWVYYRLSRRYSKALSMWRAFM